MPRDGVRLTPRHRLFVYGSSALLFLTGAAWLVAHTWMRVEGEFGDMPHPLERWSRQAHGALAMLFLMALGSLVRGHIRAGWRSKRSRLSGATMVAASATLIVSGWCLYYVGDEDVRAFTSQVHWLLGLAGPIIIGAHVLGRRSAVNSAEAPRNIRDERAPDSRDSSREREWSASSRPAASSSQSPACTAS